MMGAGKSTLGKHLARRLRLPYTDTDEEIVARTGASIATIFELEGEESFRDREAGVLRDLTQTLRGVLSTGGGAVLREENRKLLRQSGLVVYLHADPELLAERTKASKNRPLLRVDDRLQRIRELYQARDQIYRMVADITIESTREPLQKIVARVVARIARVRRAQGELA